MGQSVLGTLLVVALLISGCTKSPKGETPEAALHQYVQAAFTAKTQADREKLKALSTGEALFYLEEMSEEDFKRQFLDSKLEFVNLRARDLRQEEGGGVSLMYELEYRNSQDNSRALYSNKKIAYLVREESGPWKIRATKNIKTFIEKKEDLVITPDTTHDQAPGKQTK
jgi:hypothetical protein